MSEERRHGFHEGERAVQRQVGVEGAAARLEPMLDPAELSHGVARFLSERSFVAISARDTSGMLWVSPLTGIPGFVEVTTPTTLAIHASPVTGDPLHGLTAGQPTGLIALDYARRRRFRLNGTLEGASADQLSVRVEEAFGNCPQFIPQQVIEVLDSDTSALTPVDRALDVASRLSDDDRERIARANTFILGTTHPERGNDASHRGGTPGFVRTTATTLWWPDYAGNNLFNSLGNLNVDPHAALLFLDHERGMALHLTGTARLDTTVIGAPGDDGHTGRRVVLTLDRVVRSPLTFHADLVRPYDRNPPLTDT